MAAAPITDVRTQLKAILATAFPGVPIHDGRLHEAHPGPAIGVYPVEEAAGARELDQNTSVRVQVFLGYKEQVRRDYVASSTNIEAAAQAFREAFYAATHPYAGTTSVWYMQIVRVAYEPDPVGQITRFTATVIGLGQNYAETSA